MRTPARLADLGAEQFVSLTTFRRSGEPVATPVWAAPAEVRRLSTLLQRKYGLLARIVFATDRLARRRQRVMLRLTDGPA